MVLLKVLDVLINDDNFPLRYYCLTSEGSKIILHADIHGMDKLEVADFHQHRCEKAVWASCRAWSNLMREKHKMELLQADQVVRTRQTLPQRRAIKAPFLERLQS